MTPVDWKWSSSTPAGNLLRHPSWAFTESRIFGCAAMRPADLLVVEEAPHASGRVPLDHEVLVEAGMANLDVLHAQPLSQVAEEARAVDLEPEALRIEVGSPEAGVGLARLAGAHREGIERDDPVVGANLDGGRREEVAFVEAAAHLTGELPPDLLPARSEEGLEEAHRNRTTGCLTFRSVLRSRSWTVTHSQRFWSTE